MGHLIVSPGREGGIRIGASRYAELRDATPAAPVPDWLAAAASAAWGLDLAGQAAVNTIIVRPETEYRVRPRQLRAEPRLQLRLRALLSG
jgi:hypothetical protein